MKNRSTFYLFLAVVLLGLYILFIERKLDHSEKRRAEALRAIKITPEKVTYLRVECKDYFFECTRQGARWRFIKPIEGLLDVGQIERMLVGFAALKRGEVITVEEMEANQLTLHDYGLSNPQIKLIFGMDAHRRTILVGHGAQVGDRLYIKEKTTPEIAVTSTNLLRFVPEDITSLRDRCLLHGDLEQVVRIEIRKKEGLLQLARGEQGIWHITQPIKSRADGREVLDLMDRLYAIRIDQFVEDDVVETAMYGFDETATGISLIRADGKSESLLLGKNVEGETPLVYARFRTINSIYTVPREIINILAVDPETLRDKRLLALSSDDVAGVEIKTGKQILSMRRAALDTQWAMVKPRGWPVEKKVMDSLLGHWTQAEVAGVMALNETNQIETGLIAPWITLHLLGLPPNTEIRSPTNLAIKAAITVGTGKSDTDRLYVSVDQEPWIYEVSGQVMTFISLDPLFYRNRTLLAVAPEAVLRIAVKRGVREQAVQRDENGQFQPVGAENAVVDDLCIRRILKNMNNLRAIEFVEANPDPDNLTRYGLDQPVLTVTVGLQDKQAINKTLLIGKRTGKGRYAMMRGQDVVCVIGSQDAGLLENSLFK